MEPSSFSPAIGADVQVPPVLGGLANGKRSNTEFGV